MKKSLAIILSMLLIASLVPATVAESETHQYGGVLTTLAMEGNNMFPAISSSTAHRFNFSPAVEALGRRNPETGDTEPWLAESFTVDADALTLTIKLQEGIKFSDGSEFNADAVIWNFDKMVGYGKASELCTPDSYVKTDDYTVVLHYSAWSNIWVDMLGECYIYCPAAFEANGEEWATLHAVGTGPFLQSEFVQDSHVTYVRNENYWREGEPYLDGIELKYISDSMTQYASFLNKELDVLRNPNVANIQQLLGQGYENVALDAPDLAGITYMMFCSGDETSPFADQRVRLAVMYAVDWEDMALGIYDGLGAATPVFAVPGAWSYDENLEIYPYDLAKSQELLTEAGYPNGFNTTISINEGNAANMQCATILQAYLEMIGIKAEIKSLTSADFNAQKAEGTYDKGIMVNNGSSKLDFTANYIRLYSSEGVNYKVMMAKPADYEEALFGARAAKTQEEKKELLKTAARLFSHDYALVVATGYQSAYCFAQEGVHDTGICTTTAEAWTPNWAWKAQ